MLTPKEIILLDNLIFGMSFTVDEGTTVESVITKLKKMPTPKNGNMTSQEWKKILKLINDNSKLSKYKIFNIVESDDLRAAIFYKSISILGNYKDVYLIFRGTASKEGWDDNVEGVFQSDTKEQIKALKYINVLPPKLGNKITVSGHSKGGNRAAYLTILSNRVSRGLTFDGQGFSKKFLLKYQKQIHSKKNKLLAINASGDYVSCLMHSVAGKTILIDTPKEQNPLAYHKPNIVLQDNGDFYPITNKKRTLARKTAEFYIDLMAKPRSTQLKTLKALASTSDFLLQVL